MMNKKYIKKLERILGENGINDINGYDLDNDIVSKFMENDGVKDYLDRPYRDFDFEECPVKAEFNLKDGSRIEVEGSINKAMTLDDQPYTEINIDNVYAIDSQGNKSNCNFEYTYEN